MRFPAVPLLALQAALIASPAAAGVIRGRLWMSADAPATRVGGAGAAPDARRQRRAAEAVIYVEAVPQKVERQLTSSGLWLFRRPAKPRVPRIVQIDRRFSPYVMAVAAGTSVAFQNLDRVYHSTFSVSPAKRFDLGKYPPGHCDTVTFDRVGVVNLHCDIYPDMQGYVVVIPNHAFTRPDSLGSYVLPKLPPGSYTVSVFHPRRGAIRRTVEMPRRGDVTLDLRF